MCKYAQNKEPNVIQDSMLATDSWRWMTCLDLVRWKGTAIP